MADARTEALDRNRRKSRSSELDDVEAGLRSANSALSLGLYDRLVGSLRGTDELSRTKALEKEHPLASAIGSTAGGLTQGVLAGPALPSTAVARSMGPLAGAVANAAEGAGLSAATALNRGEDPREAASLAAAMGFAAPGILRGLDAIGDAKFDPSILRSVGGDDLPPAAKGSKKPGPIKTAQPEASKKYTTKDITAADALRDEPLRGGPPDVMDEKAYKARIKDYADAALLGKDAWDWYPRFGKELDEAGRGNPYMADRNGGRKMIRAFGPTSAQTPLQENMNKGLNAFTAEYFKAPIKAGGMGAHDVNVEKLFRDLDAGQPYIRDFDKVGDKATGHTYVGPKIGPYIKNLEEGAGYSVRANATPGHNGGPPLDDAGSVRAVHDVHDMRLHGYPDGIADESPTTGMHNYMDRADEDVGRFLREEVQGPEMPGRPGPRYETTPHQRQAGGWVTQRVRSGEGGMTYEQSAIGPRDLMENQQLQISRGIEPGSRSGLLQGYPGRATPDDIEGFREGQMAGTGEMVRHGAPTGQFKQYKSLGVFSDKNTGETYTEPGYQTSLLAGRRGPGEDRAVTPIMQKWSEILALADGMAAGQNGVGITAMGNPMTTKSRSFDLHFGFGGTPSDDMVAAVNKRLNDQIGPGDWVVIPTDKGLRVSYPYDKRNGQNATEFLKAAEGIRREVGAKNLEPRVMDHSTMIEKEPGSGLDIAKTFTKEIEKRIGEMVEMGADEGMVREHLNRAYGKSASKTFEAQHAMEAKTGLPTADEFKKFRSITTQATKSGQRPYDAVLDAVQKGIIPVAFLAVVGGNREQAEQ